MKQIFKNHLNQIWTKWLTREAHYAKFDFEINPNFYHRSNTDQFSVESFLMEYEEKMTKRQRSFANHILQVMVEVQNHEHLDETLLEK